MFPINPAMMFNQIRNTGLGNPAQLLGGTPNALAGASPLGQALSSLATPLGSPQLTATPSIGNGANLPSLGTSNAIAPAGQSPAPAGPSAPPAPAAPSAGAAPMGAAEGGGKKKKCKKGKKKCQEQIMQQLQQLQQGQAQMQDQLKRIEGRLDQMGQLNPAMKGLLASSMGQLPSLGMGAGLGMGLPASPYTAALSQLGQVPAMAMAAMPVMPMMPQLPALAQPAVASAGNAARMYFEQTKLMVG